MIPHPLRRALAAIALIAAGTAAGAGCTGPSLVERLSPEQRLELSARAEAVPYGEGLLWEARKGDARILLAGTMHLHDERHDATLAALAPAIRDADLVLLEMTPEEERALQRAMVEEPGRVLITDGPTLPERLDPETWDLIAGAARARGMPPFTVARFRPWFLMLTLSLPPCAMADAAAGLRGLDHLIMDEAEASGVPMAALEPWDTLFQLMGDDDEAAQIEMLSFMLLDEELMEASLVATREGYFAGRIAEMWELSRMTAELMPVPGADAKGFAELEEHLLLRRNAAWLPVIEAAAGANPRLVVAAGAAHLPGEDGVLRLLERGGWAIRPLDPAACCGAVWETP